MASRRIRSGGSRRVVGTVTANNRIVGIGVVQSPHEGTVEAIKRRRALADAKAAANREGGIAVNEHDVNVHVREEQEGLGWETGGDLGWDAWADEDEDDDTPPSKYVLNG